MTSLRLKFHAPDTSSKTGNWLQLALILSATVGIVSAASHGSIRWLKIKASWGGFHGYGQSNMAARTILHGSSVAYAGIDWTGVSEALGQPIACWATPGSTPSEWEQMHRRAPEVTTTFLVVSPSDLNEYSLCDSRAAIVPLATTIRDLWEVHTDLPLCKKILTQYPLSLVRLLFPTAGRSDGVMVGVRSKLQKLVGGGSKPDQGAAPIFDYSHKSEDKEKVSDWSEARLQRRLNMTRRDSDGRYSFIGSKQLAVRRLTQQARHQGQVLLIVMPLPPVYKKEFLPESVMREFENALADVMSHCPEAQIIRIDRLPKLNNDDLYSDQFHMNMYGQQIATEAVLSRLKALGILP